jgi:hypothetical protein
MSWPTTDWSRRCRRRCHQISALPYAERDLLRSHCLHQHPRIGPCDAWRCQRNGYCRRPTSTHWTQLPRADGGYCHRGHRLSRTAQRRRTQHPCQKDRPRHHHPQSLSPPPEHLVKPNPTPTESVKDVLKRNRQASPETAHGHDLVRSTGGTWITCAPTLRPNWHELGGGQILVRSLRMRHHDGGHTTWTCCDWDATIYGLPVDPVCSIINGPAAVRNSFVTGYRR